MIVSLATLALASAAAGQREGRPVPSSALDPRVAAAVGPTPAATTGPADRSTTTPPPVPSEVAVPVGLRVGSVGIRLPVVPKGVSSDGQMALPPKPDRVGWWRFGSAPDERGSTVLAGHVDTRRSGIGPLARLREVEVGDEVALALSDGRTARYRTVRVHNIDKQSDALAAVFDEDGPSRLHVVTCGGEFDPENGAYQDNVVLTAVPLPRADR